VSDALSFTDADVRRWLSAAIRGSIADVVSAEQQGTASERLRNSNRAKRFIPRCGALLVGAVRGKHEWAGAKGFYLDKSEVTPSLASGAGEFLWDIFVGAPSPGVIGDSFRLGQGLVAVESELKNVLSKLERDFTKLLVAKVAFRLFVMPRLRDGPKRTSFLNQLAGQCRSAEVACLVAEIPSLKKWTSDAAWEFDITLTKFSMNGESQ
jgi:hypothetical protein